MTMLQSSVSDTRAESLYGFTARLRLELEAALRNVEARLVQAPEADDISMAIHQRSHDAHHEIGAALARLSEGTYGVCQTCGGAMSDDRLDAMPHARHCVNCAHGVASKSRRR